MLFSLVIVALVLVTSWMTTVPLSDFVFSMVFTARANDSDLPMDERYRRVKNETLQREITGLVVQLISIDLVAGIMLTRLGEPWLFVVMIAAFALVRLGYYLWMRAKFAERRHTKIIGASAKCANICLILAFLLNVPWGQPFTI